MNLGWGWSDELFKKRMLQNGVLSRVREAMQSCGEQREGETFEENHLFF